MDSESASDVGECYTTGAYAHTARDATNVNAIVDDDPSKKKQEEEDLGAKLLNLRDIAKPPLFNGSDAAWPEFRCRFEA
eukprot:1676759-Heterocapsa_arctica.AAC.1